MANEELKACPFCGEAAILLEKSNGPDRPHEYQVLCTRYCTEAQAIREDAIAAWNTRTETEQH